MVQVVRLVPAARGAQVVQVVRLVPAAHHAQALAHVRPVPAALAQASAVALLALAQAPVASTAQVAAQPVVAVAASAAVPQVLSVRAVLVVRARLASRSVRNAKSTSRDKLLRWVAQLCHAETARPSSVCVAVRAFKTLPTRLTPMQVS